MVGEAPTPVAPPSPAASMADYEGSQRYLNASSAGGIGAKDAWALGLSGAGVSMCDIEYDFDDAHCDLPAITVLGGPPQSPYGNSHGTAVFGEMVSLDDGVGTTGIAFGADDLYFAPTYIDSVYDIGAAVYRATAAMPAGSVIVLEVQIAGPNYAADGTQDGLVPMGGWPPYYDSVMNAIANGMIVVQAAGNAGEPRRSGVRHRELEPPSLPARERLDRSSSGPRRVAELLGLRAAPCSTSPTMGRGSTCRDTVPVSPPRAMASDGTASDFTAGFSGTSNATRSSPSMHAPPGVRPRHPRPFARVPSWVRSWSRPALCVAIGRAHRSVARRRPGCDRSPAAAVPPTSPAMAGSTAPTSASR